MEQNTPEWLEHRKSGIGGSDAPIVMAVSPYSTPLELWKEKIGIKQAFVGNYATDRGQRLEPAARAAYEILNDIEMPPLLIQHRDFPFLRASLDGANLEKQMCLEIKCIGKATFFAAKEHKQIPIHHWVQVQHQLLVSGFKEAHYFAYWQGQGSLVKVLPDLNYFPKLLTELLVFWKFVETQTPPPMIELDYKNQAKVLRKANKLEKLNNAQ